MSQRELRSFRWDGTQWTTMITSSNFEFDSKTCTQDAQNTLSTANNKFVRIATFNILADCFPWFIEMAIRSTNRFEWLCHGITSLNPTIIGLNEVTITALQQLQQCPFIRENYFITELSDGQKNDDGSIMREHYVNGLLSPHGCVILSKLPFLEVFAISISNSRHEAVVVKVRLTDDSETCVYICSQHTTAYQTPKNAQLRAQQIRDIVDVLQPLGLPYIIMGDLNLHYQSEDAIIVENKFIDAWTQTHFSSIHPFNDENPGYTFDAIKNTLIPYYIPGERRQMRLDRILFSHGFPAFATTPCTIWANEPVKKDNYLFPSDHFGLYIDLVTNITDESKKVISMSEPNPAAEAVLWHNAQNSQDRTIYSVGLLQRTMALTSHLIWLGAVALGIK